MTGIKKSDTLEEISLKYFNQHYSLEGRQKRLCSLLEAATEIPTEKAQANTRDVYHVDTILRKDKWRVQLRVKYNFDFNYVVDQELVADLLQTLDIANDISFMNYQVIGDLFKEVLITLTLTIQFK